MDLLNDNLDDGLKLAFNLLFDAEYKKTSMFFIELSKIKDSVSSGRSISRKMSEKQSIWQGEMKKFQEQNNKLRFITSINLECSAHGVFNKLKLANTFLDFLQQIFQYKGDLLKLKKLKLKISGFDLNSSEELCKIIQKNGEHMSINQDCEFSFIHRLRKIIEMGRDKLESLELRINNVRCCKKEDLRDVLRLGFYESKRQQSGNKLTNLSVELSDWMFYKITHTDLANQKQSMNNSSNNINPDQTQRVCQTDWLTSTQFQDLVLGSIVQQGSQKQDNKKINMPLMKRLRLQLSTLCYEKEAFDKFKSTIMQEQYKQGSKPKYELKNKKVTQPVQYFHYMMRQLVKDIVTVVMPKLTSLELDFRNWFSDFQMKSLKDELVNINRKHQLQAIEKENNLMKESSVRSRNKPNPKTQHAFEQLLHYLIKTTQNPKTGEQEDVPLTILVVV